MQEGFEKVASLAEVPSGEMRAVKAPSGVQVALANVNGELYAIENMCSHEDASLNFGWLLPDICQVECPLHEGRFDLKTGAATQAPAEFPLRTYEVRVVGDDVYVGPVKSQS